MSSSNVFDVNVLGKANDFKIRNVGVPTVEKNRSFSFVHDVICNAVEIELFRVDIPILRVGYIKCLTIYYLNPRR